MRLHRFYLTPDKELLIGKTVRIEEARLINQWKNVFRFRAGDEVLLFNGDGNEYRARFEMLAREGAVLVVESAEKNNTMSKRTVVLNAALIKKNNFELIIEKATELGVSKIVPIVADRSEKKSLDQARAEKIAIEASEQSGRGDVPTIQAPTSLTHLLESVGEVHCLAFHPEGISLREAGKTDFVDATDALGIFIGPEGGWSERELKLFSGKKIPLVSLGSLTLRAETAAIAVLAKINL